MLGRIEVKISQSASRRKNIEKMLTTDEAATHPLLKRLWKDKKNNAEHGASNATEVIHSVSTILIGSERKDLPLEYIKKFIMAIIDIERQNGAPKYQYFDLVLISIKKRNDPKRETMLNICDIENNDNETL